MSNKDVQFVRVSVLFLGIIVIYILRKLPILPIIGPIIVGFCVGLLIWRGMLIGLIAGAFSGSAIGVYYAHLSGLVISVTNYSRIGPHWDKWGFIGSILSRGPIITLLYFIILGAIGGLIGGFITERK